MVARHRCEKDRRVVYIEITAKATKLLAKMDEHVNDLHKQLIGHLTRTELKQLVRLLEKARAPLSEVKAAG